VRAARRTDDPYQTEFLYLWIGLLFKKAHYIISGPERLIGERLSDISYRSTRND